MGSLNIASKHAPHPEQRKIYQLQDTIQRMQDEIDHLKEALASVSRTAPRWVTDWGLTMPEATILGACRASGTSLVRVSTIVITSGVRSARVPADFTKVNGIMIPRRSREGE